MAALALVALLPAPGTAQTAASTLADPTMTFDTVGTREVTLEVCNRWGCTSVVRTVRVLDPTPRISGTPTATPSTVEAGRLVHLVGAGLGRPPLAFTWVIRSLAGVVASLSGADVYWDTAGIAPGTYTATFNVGNVVGDLPALASLTPPLTITVEPALASSFYTIEPCRVLDTRESGPLTNATERDFPVGDRCGIPAEARAVAANVTVVAASGSSGHVALYPGDYPVPLTSVVNFGPGQIRANAAVLPLATDATGGLSAIARLLGGGSVHLIVDVSGYFAPPAPQ